MWGLGCVFAELLTRKRLHEWGGALYEFQDSAVIQRKESIIRDCNAASPEIGRFVELLLVQERETAPAARYLVIVPQDLSNRWRLFGK